MECENDAIEIRNECRCRCTDNWIGPTCGMSVVTITIDLVLGNVSKHRI